MKINQIGLSHLRNDKHFQFHTVIFAVLAMAIGLLFSCTSDIESAEDVLKKAESSSSDGSSSSIGGLSSGGGLSSAVQGVSSGGSSQSISVLCDFGDGDCREFPVDACLVFGQIVDFCPVIAASSSSPVPPSSGSLVPSSDSVEPPISSSIATDPSSSSSLPSGTVLCGYSGICLPVSADACAAIGGLAVQSCPESSSSVPPSSSSLIVPSSNSVVPSSSSVLPSSSSVEPSSSSVEPSSSSVPLSSSSVASSSSSETPPPPPSSSSGGSSICSADFRTVTIGTQTWAAENLNCDVEGSKCYGDDPANCTKYGRLYNWDAARSACPSGWHLPSDAEWDILVTYAGGSSTAGRTLKARSGWGWDGREGGTDEFGFSALPGGTGNSGGNFQNVGDNGNWWSATENVASNAYYRIMDYGLDHVRRDNNHKSILFSLRCLQD